MTSLQRIYSKLPNVEVEELRLNQTELNTQRMLNLMAISSIGDNGMPLYLQVVIRILRDLRIEQQRTGSHFDYGSFKRRIDEEAFKEGQLAPLQQRLETLESFMVRKQALSYQIQGVKKSREKGKVSKGGGRSHGTTWDPEVSERPDFAQLSSHLGEPC